MENRGNTGVYVAGLHPIPVPRTPRTHPPTLIPTGLDWDTLCTPSAAPECPSEASNPEPVQPPTPRLLARRRPHSEPAAPTPAPAVEPVTRRDDPVHRLTPSDQGEKPATRRRGAPLTPDQLADITRRYLAGQTLATIAPDYSYSAEGIRGVLLRAGVPVRTRAQSNQLRAEGVRRARASSS